MVYLWSGVEIGRQRGLKILCRKKRVGSNPIPTTMEKVIRIAKYPIEIVKNIYYVTLGIFCWVVWKIVR